MDFQGAPFRDLPITDVSVDGQRRSRKRDEGESRTEGFSNDEQRGVREQGFHITNDASQLADKVIDGQGERGLDS